MIEKSSRLETKNRQEQDHMCGICGFVSKQNITLGQLKIMNDTMIHRGPDDSGEEIYVFQGAVPIGEDPVIIGNL